MGNWEISNSMGAHSINTLYKGKYKAGAVVVAVPPYHDWF